MPFFKGERKVITSGIKSAILSNNFQKFIFFGKRRERAIPSKRERETPQANACFRFATSFGRRVQTTLIPRRWHRVLMTLKRPFIKKWSRSGATLILPLLHPISTKDPGSFPSSGMIFRMKSWAFAPGASTWILRKGWRTVLFWSYRYHNNLNDRWPSIRNSMHWASLRPGASGKLL